MYRITCASRAAARGQTLAQSWQSEADVPDNRPLSGSLLHTKTRRQRGPDATHARYPVGGSGEGCEHGGDHHQAENPRPR
jgi:hypothetical protein